MPQALLPHNLRRFRCGFVVRVFPQNFDLTLWIFRKQERSGLHFSLPDVHILIHNICRTVHADQVLSCRVPVDGPLLAARKNQPRIGLGLPESGHRREKDEPSHTNEKAAAEESYRLACFHLRLNLLLVVLAEVISLIGAFRILLYVLQPLLDIRDGILLRTQELLVQLDGALLRLSGSSLISRRVCVRSLSPFRHSTTQYFKDVIGLTACDGRRNLLALLKVCLLTCARSESRNSGSAALRRTA